MIRRGRRPLRPRRYLIESRSPAVVDLITGRFAREEWGEAWLRAHHMEEIGLPPSVEDAERALTVLSVAIARGIRFRWRERRAPRPCPLPADLIQRREPDPSAGPERRDERADLLRRVESLPPRQREAAALMALGLRRLAVAEALGVTHQAVWSMLDRISPRRGPTVRARPNLGS